MYVRRVQQQRRGVVLLIVLAMLGLFAAVGVSFAILARSEMAGAVAFKNQSQGFNGPSPRELLENGFNQLVFDVPNTGAGQQSAIRGHSILRDMYGGPDEGETAGPIWRPRGVGAQLRVDATNSRLRDYYGVYDGTGIFLPRKVEDPTIAPAGVISNGVLSQAEMLFQSAQLFVPREFGNPDPVNPRPGYSSDAIAFPGNALRYFPLLPFNYQRFDAVGLRAASAPMLGNSANPASGTGRFPEPELFASVDATNALRAYHWFPFDEDYDAADHNNWYLALERADGTVIQPSFHRAYFVRQLELAGVFNGNPNAVDPYPAYTRNYAEDEAAGLVSGRRAIFRPRQADVDANTVLATGLPPNFPAMLDLNANGLIGDIPEELDVDTDGDGKPDSVWVDLGYPPFRNADGELVKPLYAFKVVGLDGRINANIAGNFIPNPLATTPNQLLGVEGRPEGHVSAYGASPTEVNPRFGQILDQRNTAALGNPDYDGARGDYWPVWIQTTGAANPPYLDPLYLRVMLTGLPGVGLQPTVNGRWNNPNAAVANINTDRPGQSLVDDNNDLLTQFNANIPLETQPLLGPTPNLVRGTVSSSLGPVGFQGGRRHPPFTRRAKAMGATVGSVFPKFVNHVHGHYTAMAGYSPAFANPPTNHGPATVPDLAPGSGLGEFDVPGSHDIPSPMFWFDYSDFGIGGTGLVLPQLANNWHAVPGQLAFNNGNFPILLQALQTIMTRDEATEYNPYVPSNFNSPFTFAQLERMLRNSDIDNYGLDDRMLRLVTFNTGNELDQSAPYIPFQYNVVQAARDRMRRLFTPESVDLIHYSLTPTRGDPDNRMRDTAGMFIATPYTQASTLTVSKSPAIGDDAAIYADDLGSFPVDQTGNTRLATTINASIQHNGYMWRPAVAMGSDPELPFGNTPDAGNLLNSKELLGRYPVEVLRGRKYDLNRPLSSYESRPDIADLERTAMAQQLYVLLSVSAGINMRPQPTSIAEAREAFAQARTMAQLAVNIVDYIDPDTVMTRMRFHPFLTIADAGGNSQVAAQWNAIEGLAAGGQQTFTFANGTALTGVVTEELEVLGFEMPDLVISESVSVTYEHPSNMGGPGDAEITMVFAELFNPWPNEADMDSGASGIVPPTPRGRLFDALPVGPIPTGGRTQAQPRFMLGVRQNNVTNANVRAPQATGTFGGADSPYYVTFAPADGVFTTPRDQPNNGPDIRGGQRLLVEPNRFNENPIMMTDDSDPQDIIGDPGSATGFWQPGVGPNRFTCNAPPGNLGDGLDAATPNGEGGYDLRFTRTRPTTKDANDANVVVSLYRIRNPYANFDPVANPYIAIDTLELRGDDASGQPNAQGAYDLSKSNPPTTAERRSMERRQPWVGCDRPWVPYRGITANPPTALLDITSTPPRFMEGKFLGFPYMTADATTGVPNPSNQTQAWGNQLRANGFARSTNGTRGNTLYSDNETAATPVATNRLATQNTVDAALPANNGRYMSFPFLNRQLASPLELLSVRLYGSHIWWVPGNATPGQDREWRLRFTDDYEFIQDIANNQTTPQYPALPPGGFNRVYRSREVPWYLNDRNRHPIDPATTANYDPTTPNDNTLSPFPDLHRFFEFVECRSRVNGAGGWAQIGDTTQPNRPMDLREPRVHGKININVVADEEPFKALIDSEEAMPFTVNAVKDVLTATTAPPPNPNADRYRPINYPLDIADPAFSGGVVLMVRALGWNPPTNVSELSLSGVVDTISGAPNNSFVASGNVGTERAIDFGGGLTMTGTGFDLSPINMVGQPSNSTRVLLHNQYPGIINGYASFSGTPTATSQLYPGWDRDVQVSSELYRQFVLSRHGRDALGGTIDDKPFRGYASGYLSDTLLRRRNYAYLDFPREGQFASTASVNIAGSTLNHPAVPGANNQGPPGEYITRLGGQWTPRLFDPVPLPFVLDNSPPNPAGITPNNTVTMAQRADVAAGDPPNTTPAGVEYWMLEWRRNELLAKISNNVTSRSNVFGIWVTVGYFRVEPGTENLLVPLLHEEVGSNQGKQIRHRMFSILDRTEFREYTTEMMNTPPRLENNPGIRHFSFIE